MGTTRTGWDGTTPVASGLELVGHSDLDGHGDGMHVNVRDGVAYVGHMGETRVGTSILDVSDPTAPRVVRQLETPIGTHSHKVQLVGDILLVNHERNHREPRAATWSSGLKVYDVADPFDPRPIGFLHTPGIGVHRMTYWEAPYAYMSASDEGFSDQFLLIADLSDPTQPVEVGRWWMPGMNLAAGETPEWGEGRVAKHHHAIVRDDLAFCGWWDLGLVILDVADKARPRLVSHLDFGADVSRATHSAVPVPGRDVLVVTDEETVDDCAGVPKHVRVVDIADPAKPRVIATFPVPEGDFCDRGRRFGPHNVHEMRPGSYVDPDRIFLAYFNAGLRVIDISDPTNPVEEAYYVPETPPGQPSIQLNDLMVDADGLVYVTDRYNGGLYILRQTS